MVKAGPAADGKTLSEGGMFTIEAAQDGAGRVIVMGKPSRKRANTFINIPISGELRDRLGEQVLGSLAMGTGALIEWALKELQRQGISIKVVPRN
nr:hypothetical protein [Gammaproteobacteria bacterium]